MSKAGYSSLLNDKLLKERSRLLILCYLISSEMNSATFMELQKTLNMTRGNLSAQIKMLTESKYVDIKKEFKNNKPQTTITISDVGIISLKRYLKDMETIINDTYDK